MYSHMYYGSGQYNHSMNNRQLSWTRKYNNNHFIISSRAYFQQAAYIISHTKETRSLSEPRGLLRESPVLQEAYTKTCPNSAKNYTYENMV